jgi:hypothetical protein
MNTVNQSLTTSAVVSGGTTLQLRRHHAGSGFGSEDWLTEMREMRGRTWYDQGRRPSFHKSDGGYSDADPIDLDAYHVIASRAGQVVGCARVLPLKDVTSCSISATIGDQRFQRILQTLETAWERTCEASRWVVVPECRGELGPRLVAASWAVAHWLGIEFAFVLAGTRQKQDLALIRMGARAIRGFPLFHSSVWDDELRLLYFDVLHPPRSIQKQMIVASALLNVTDVVSPVASPSTSLTHHTGLAYKRFF